MWGWVKGAHNRVQKQIQSNHSITGHRLGGEIACLRSYTLQSMHHEPRMRSATVVSLKRLETERPMNTTEQDSNTGEETDTCSWGLWCSCRSLPGQRWVWNDDGDGRAEAGPGSWSLTLAWLSVPQPRSHWSHQTGLVGYARSILIFIWASGCPIATVSCCLLSSRRLATN